MAGYRDQVALLIQIIPEIEKVPAIQWKLENLLAIEASNPKKHEELVSRLQKQLEI